MAEQSGFFRSVSGDRAYSTDFLARWVAAIISNGVYNGELAATAAAGMAVSLPAGRAWINGYYYRNDAALTLTISNADGVLHRKDSIVLRWDVNARRISALVLAGSPASSPVAPSVVRNAEQYDLLLAEIYIPAGTTAISQALITDKRLDNTVCGIVHGVVSQVDTSTLYAQIQADLANFRTEAQGDFDAWFAQVQDVLDENTAGHLLSLITSLDASAMKTSVYATGSGASNTHKVDHSIRADSAANADNAATANRSSYADAAYSAMGNIYAYKNVGGAL